MKLTEWYTRVIGVFFVLVVVSLVTDFVSNGFHAETMHKIFHVVLGLIVIKFGWSNERFWQPFCLVNGAFFCFVAVFGWLFMDFGGLDAFNFVDTVLHSIVGLSGLAIGMLDRKS